MSVLLYSVAIAAEYLSGTREAMECVILRYRPLRSASAVTIIHRIIVIRSHRVKASRKWPYLTSNSG